MTCAAFLGGETVAVRAAANVHGVRMSVIPLPRKISLRVAVHATRVAQYGNERSEKRAIAGWIGSNVLRDRRFRCGY